jgi:protoheme ferro-lyase
LLLAHGAPDKLEDIPEFLLNVRGGRPLPESAVKESETPETRDARVAGRLRSVG